LGDLRKDVVFFVNDTIASLEVDSANGYLFWISLNGICRSRLDGSEIHRIVKQNRYVSSITLDRYNKRLLYLEMAGSKIFSIDYEGGNLNEFPKLFNFPNNRITYESVLVQDDFLYFAAHRQLRGVQLSNGMPKNETNKLLFNLTSTVLEFHARLQRDCKFQFL
jgi:hypothetical protein